jgi:hypothetical protein
MGKWHNYQFLKKRVAGERTPSPGYWVPCFSRCVTYRHTRLEFGRWEKEKNGRPTLSSNWTPGSPPQNCSLGEMSLN